MSSIIIFENGMTTNGKIFRLPALNSECLTLVRSVENYFGSQNLRRCFTKDGHEIAFTDLDLLKDGDILYAAGKEEDFIPISQNSALALKKTGESNEIPENSDFLKLNVGGTVFVTSKTTLINGAPDSVLAKMFDPDSELPAARLDKNGAYLLDRDPKYFAPILNFLRTGTLVIDQGINPIGVVEEAVFFGIQACIPAGYVSREKATMQDALDQYDSSKVKLQKQLSDEKEMEKIKLQLQIFKLSLDARDVQIREMEYKAKFTFSDSDISKGYGPNLTSDGDASGVAYQLATLGSKCKNL